MDPLTGIYTALTRRDLAGGESFAPGQRIGLQVALAAYTSGGAYACFREPDLGRITPGRAADLIAVSPDPFRIEPEQIRDCRVDLTIAAGQVCHRAI
jgi:predicted amidohydrolase YtcJ